MGQLMSRESPQDLIDEAHSLKSDPVSLEVLRENILLSGRSVTMFPSKGLLHPNRYVYAGDLSYNAKGIATQIRPLLCLEYLPGSNAALIKHGITQEVLMMVVREGCEVGYVEGDRMTSCSWGGETEARLYCNGAPQAVNISKDCLDVAPTPQEKDVLDSTGHLCLGSSMVELVKHSEEQGIELLSLRAPDGTPVRRVAAFSQVAGQHVAVFKMLDCGSADPLATLVMAWWTSFDNN